MGLTDPQRRVHGEIMALTRAFYSHAHDHMFQRNLADGLPNQWHCRAGARYLLICEDGLVHWCSQQRNYPATPLDEYTAADLDRELTTRKSCAPCCTVSCVHRVAMLDRLREQPEDTIHAMVAAHTAQGGRTPVGVRVLRWTFLAGPPKRVMRRLASWAAGG